MTTNKTPSTSKRFGTFVRHVWDDQVAAHRALLRVSPYDEYLFNRRNAH
jgi:hypothetical protein